MRLHRSVGIHEQDPDRSPAVASVVVEFCAYGQVGDPVVVKVAQAGHRPAKEIIVIEDTGKATLGSGYLLIELPQWNVIGPREPASVVAIQVVTQRGDSPRAIAAGRVIGDDGVGERDSTPAVVVNPTTVVFSRVLTHGAVNQGQRALVADAATVGFGRVAADGAVGQVRHTRAIVADAATPPGRRIVGDLAASQG